MFNNTIGFYGAVVGIVALTVGPTLYLGHKQDIQAELLDKAAERLTSVPSHFGPWLQREEDSLNETAVQILGNPRQLCRTYVHSETGETVSMVLLAGLAGPMAVHTPEICMPSREYEMIKPATPIEIVAHGGKHGFFATLFRAKTLEGQKLNVYYGWSRDGDQWEAPNYPRVAFAPLPMLYKVQVVCQEPTSPDAGPTAGELFLADLLPFLASQHSQNPQ
jgi:Protein of unknown function (DUF3485)